MASTYTANKLNLEKPANGDQVGAWDVPVNANWTDIDKGAGGSATASLAGGDWTVSQADAKNLRLIPTGTLSASRNVTLPATYAGFWLITNSATIGAYTVTVKTAAGGSTGVTIPASATTLVYSDGTNVKYGNDGPLSLYLTLAGGTMTGTLNLPSNGLNVGSGQLVVSSGNVTASGNITATGNITAYSDERFKTDIITIHNAVELVRRLRGVRYDKDGRRNVGVIAQEIQRILPEVVVTDEAGFKSVAYGNIVGVLIEAIKELSSRVEYLEKRK